MATTPVSPASSGSNFDLIGAALADSGPSQTDSQPASDTPSEVTTETPEAPAPEPETTPEPEKTETPEVPEAKEEESNPYDEQPEGEFQPQTLGEILKTADGKRMYANHKLVREMAKPVDQGGIGHVPTLEQQREYYGAFRDRVIMDHHLSSGDTKGAQTFLQYAFNPQRGEGAQTVAGHLATTLAQVNPEAYAAAAQPFLSNYGTALWDRWSELPDGADGSPQKRLKDAIEMAAQIVEKDMTGKYRSVPPGQQQANAQPDPLAQERAQLEADKAQIAQQRATDQQSFQRNWEGGLVGNITQGLGTELDVALAPLQKMHEASPRIYQALRKEFHDHVVSNIQRDKHAWDLFQVRLAEARRSGTPDAQKAVASEYVKLAKPIIQAERKKFLEEAGAVAKQQSDARHAELRSIDSKKALNTGGSPVTPSTGAPLARQAGESQSDFNLRQLRA